ncbi:MAG: hypothetical protein IT381_27750 [Deltaproteobacteria bacterium]|nr:hypothetical protein [Deltaproteobacteria bacterium]
MKQNCCELRFSTVVTLTECDGQGRATRMGIVRLKSVIGMAAALLACGVAASAEAAHAREIGFSFEPTFLALPAIANEATQPVMTMMPAASLSLEFAPVNNLVILIRGAYGFAVLESQIGQATIDNRTGQYWFRQSTALAFGGLRLETPSHWMPCTLGIGAMAGAGIFIQTDRDLRNDAGISYNRNLTPLIRPTPILGVSAFIAGRIWHQIRLGAEPTLYVVFSNPVSIGFGINLSLSFLFFV